MTPAEANEYMVSHVDQNLPSGLGVNARAAFRASIGANSTRTGPLVTEDAEDFIATLLSDHHPDTAVDTALQLEIMLPRFPDCPNIVRTWYATRGEPEGAASARIRRRFPQGTGANEIPDPAGCVGFTRDVIDLFQRTRESQALGSRLAQFERESGTRIDPRATKEEQWSQLGPSAANTLETIYKTSSAMAHQTICPVIF